MTEWTAPTEQEQERMEKIWREVVDKKKKITQELKEFEEVKRSKNFLAKASAEEIQLAANYEKALRSFLDTLEERAEYYQLTICGY